MLQFQGMIAEYERAQILERSRRGKRHRAKAGEVSVLGGAPYGYRYIRKTPEMPAALRDRRRRGRSGAAGIRQIHGRGPQHRRHRPAVTGDGPRDPQARDPLGTLGRVGMLRNPAYKGTACFNKTQVGPRQKVTKPFRLSGRAVHGEKTSAHERPRDEWIEMPVPAIVSEETFALAAERLADNKRFAPRRTIEPSLVQGLVSCKQMRLRALRTSTRSSAPQNPLLPLPGLGCLAPSRRIRLRQPPDPPGSARSHRVAGGYAADRGSWRSSTAELDRRLDAARASRADEATAETLSNATSRASAKASNAC